MNSYSTGTPCSEVYKATIEKRAEFIGKRLKHAKRILDIGCGYGIYTDSFLKMADFYVGLDISFGNLLVGLNTIRSNSMFVCGDAEHLPFLDESFDVVAMIEALEHVENDSQCIREVYRILKPGGTFIFSVPNKLFPFETHGIRIGSKIIASPLGIGFPMLPYFPSYLRKMFATAKVYNHLELKHLLIMSGFNVNQIEFLMPNMDTFEAKSGFKKFPNIIRNLFDKIENSKLRWIGSTVIMVTTKKFADEKD